MLDRLILAGVIIALGTATWILFNRLSIRRLVMVAPADPILTGARRGVPTILYFTTPDCIPCRTLQRPALNEIEATMGSRVQVIEIDSVEQPDVADRWGVFSAPTTFILDEQGKPRRVNRGVALADTLKKQLNSLAS